MFLSVRHLVSLKLLVLLLWAGAFFNVAHSQSVQFDGVDDHVSIGDDAGTAAARFTVETWFKRAAGGRSEAVNGSYAYPLISRGNASNYFLGVDTSGRLFGAFLTNGAMRSPIRSTASVPLGEWHHGAMTYDGIAMRLFLDGQQVAEQALDRFVNEDVITNTPGTRLGQIVYNDLPYGAFAGQMAETRIWNYPRTQAEIEKTRFSKLQFQPGLLARWGLDSGTTNFTSGGANQIASALKNGAAPAADGPPFLNVVPSANVTSPTAPVMAVTGTPLVLSATASDPNDAIDRVEFYADHTKVGEDLQAPYELTWTPSGAGVEVVRAVAVDAAGNRNGSSAGTAVTIAPSLTPQAVAFDGVTGRAALSPSPNLAPAELCVEACFYLTGDGTPARFVYDLEVNPVTALISRSSSQGIRYLLGIRTTGDHLVGAVGTTFVQGKSTVSRNAWHHAALTSDGTILRIYLDGVLESECRLNSSLVESATTYTQVGALALVNSSGGVAYTGMFEGIIDEVRIWNQARPGGAIAGMRHTRITTAPSLLARWGFDEASGLSLVGDGASGVGGTLVGTASRVGGIANTVASLPQVTLTSPAPNATIARDQPLLLEATATSAGPAIARVEFWDQRQKLGEDLTSPYALTWAAAPTGMNRVTAVAIDEQGVAGSSVPVAVNVTTVPGLGALHFVENNDFAGSTIASGPLRKFTVEFQFRREEVGSAGGAVQGTSAEPLAIFSTGTGIGFGASKWAVGIRNQDGALVASGGYYAFVAGSTPVTMGAWHHAALTYDGAIMRLFLDGVLQGTVAVEIDEGYVTSYLELSRNSSGGYFRGDISEVRVWNYARSVTEILGCRSQDLIAETGLLARWGFMEGTGTSAASTGSAAAPMSLDGLTFSDAPTASIGAPTVAITSPAAGASFPIQVGFPVTCSASDADGSISRVELYLGDTLVGQDQTAPYEFVVTPTTIIPDTLRAVAVDNAGLTKSAIIPVNIAPPVGGSGLYFDGVNDYVAVNADPRLSAEQFTIETWIRRDGVSQSSGPTLVSRGDYMPSNQMAFNYQLGLSDSGSGTFVRGLFSTPAEFGGYDDIILGGTTPLEDGVWYHLAMTYDGRELRLYVDGQLDASKPAHSVPLTATSLRTTLGATVTSAGAISQAFHGYLDEVRIWNHARSQASIAADRWTLNFTDPALLAQWSMQEGTGPTLVNKVAGAANGTISGAVRTIDHPSAGSASPSISLVVTGARTLGQTLKLETNPVAGSGAVNRVEFYANGAKLGESIATPWDWNYLPPAAGRYLISAIARDSAGGIAASNDVVIDILPPAGSGAVYFDGEDDYLELPPRAEMALTSGTLEAWVRPYGAGRPSFWNSTLGWITPIVAQGDLALGITADGRPVATRSGFPAANTALPYGVWSHVAIVYDGTNIRIYINGIEDLVVSGARLFPTKSLTFGMMRNSASIRVGAFHGSLDEVRLWSGARTPQQISANMSREIHAASGLVAHLGFEETAGSVAQNTAIPASDATLYNGVTRVDGAPLTKNAAPLISLSQPANESVQAVPATLSAAVSDPAGEPLSTTFTGREIPRDTSEFTVVVLPSSKNYAASLNGGSPATLNAMMDWIVANRAQENIVCVVQTGDVCTNDAAAFTVASGAFAKLENPTTTGLPAGIPYTIYQPTGLNSLYTYFGAARFTNRPWFIGRNSTGTDPGPVFFTAGGIDFGVTQDQSTTLANDLATWPDRQFIVIAENDQSIPAAAATANVPVILTSGSKGVKRTLASSAGRIYNHFTANYSDRPNGGEGLMRLLRFSPTAGKISVRTWSTTKGAFETDADNEFTTPWQSPLVSTSRVSVGTVGPSVAASASVPWTQVVPGRRYEWTAEATDGFSLVAAPPRTFSTLPPVGAQPPVITLTTLPGSSSFTLPTTIYVAATASSPDDSIEKVEWLINGTSAGSDAAAPYNCYWRPGAPGTYQVVAAAVDRRGLRTLSSPLTFNVATSSTFASVTTSITPFTTGATLYDAGTINLTAAASGSLTTVSSVDFFANGTWIGSDSNSPYQVPWSYSGSGTVRVHSMVTGANGMRQFSAPYIVTITPLANPTLTRFPSLHQPAPDAVSIRWRTTQSHPGRVWYGTAPNALTSFVDDANSSTNHLARLTGLQPNTRYYYGVGSPSTLLPDNRSTTYFTTPPLVGRAKKTRIWVIGDAGQGNAGQTSTRNAYTTFTGTRETDVLLSLGDQAYTAGASADFQTKFFDPYATLLRRAFCFPTLGDRDTGGSVTHNANNSYYTSFALPSAWDPLESTCRHASLSIL